jgi:transcription initiation factor IIE alpha subunit
MSLIKNRQKELYKNRKIVKKLKYKLDEYTEKDLFISTNNSSSSTFSLLNPEELPQNHQR